MAEEQYFDISYISAQTNGGRRPRTNRDATRTDVFIKAPSFIAGRKAAYIVTPQVAVYHALVGLEDLDLVWESNGWTWREYDPFPRGHSIRFIRAWHS
jgi:hypothetical protein